MTAPILSSSGPLRRPATGSIARRRLHDEIVENIRDLIVTGRLAAGVKVPEKDLCARFSVSRTPLREALKVLAFEGLVILNPNRGATVSTLSIEDIRQCFPVVGTLEALACRLACLRATEAEIEAIRADHDMLVSRYAARDLVGYFSANERVHRGIHLAARNDLMTAYLKSLSGRMRRARLSANLSEERWAQATSEHVLMIDALESRDGERLSVIMTKHIANKFISLEKAMRDQPALLLPGGRLR